ncbi:hypothetical protein DB30_07131 [Enhygromyxa salina]|uniref:Uncharacterized protein n=1 Tax=Enhygromyxa salina TaxID=215803 RepID=A0A0C2CWY4_9BACT|nr:hypothetical protein [Enhygromyxa salina]KIG14135.1 hypothetical protein DB30_07131 [Enhygromyxa salina]
MDWPKIRALRTNLRARLDEVSEAGGGQDATDALESSTLELARALPRVLGWEPARSDLDALIESARKLDRLAAAYLGRDELTTEEREAMAMELGLARETSFPDMRDVLLGTDPDWDDTSSGYASAWMNQVFHLLHRRSREDQDTAVDALAFVLGMSDDVLSDADPIAQLVGLLQRKSAGEIANAVDALRAFLDELDAQKAGH